MTNVYVTICQDNGSSPDVRVFAHKEDAMRDVNKFD